MSASSVQKKETILFILTLFSSTMVKLNFICVSCVKFYARSLSRVRCILPLSALRCSYQSPYCLSTPAVTWWPLISLLCCVQILKRAYVLLLPGLTTAFVLNIEDNGLTLLRVRSSVGQSVLTRSGHQEHCTSCESLLSLASCTRAV